MSQETYLKLLDRLYTRLPERVKKMGDQTLPALNILNIGANTIIRNFNEFCDRIRREPKLVAKYLLKELAVAGSITDNGQLVMQGKFSSSVINILIERFIKNYVRCATCGSIDTILKKEKNIWIIKCLACGAETSTKPL
ncbi:MAG: translation initiation factor IF-2 subunit beta [Sulfolobaceae archaeon]